MQLIQNQRGVLLNRYAKTTMDGWQSFQTKLRTTLSILYPVIQQYQLEVSKILQGSGGGQVECRHFLIGRHLNQAQKSVFKWQVMASGTTILVLHRQIMYVKFSQIIPVCRAVQMPYCIRIQVTLVFVMMDTLK